MATLLKYSKGIHKYLGLLLILFLMWMSLTGILLNHPGLISGISVPGWLVPGHYHLHNWNRSAMTRLLFSQKNPNIAYAAGKQGIWISDNGGKSFEAYMEGFPPSHYYRKTADIFLWEKGPALLFAATNSGLYMSHLSDKRWSHIPLGDQPEPVQKILAAKDSLLVFTDSNAYISALPPEVLRFQGRELHRSGYPRQVTLVRLFFDLHDGKIWGLPGKLVFDAVGLVLFFLSLSAFYSWYYPWKRRREKDRGIKRSASAMRRMFKWFFKYHLKLGIWTASILLIIGGTGLFMRPPLLVALVNGSLSAAWYPGRLPENPWDRGIQNALYDAEADRIIIQASDGLWAGPAHLKGPFQKIDLQLPIFVMGATVFEADSNGALLVGSFNGIYRREEVDGQWIDLLNNRPAEELSAVRPSETMITGYFRTPQGESFVNTHHQGILPINGAHSGERFSMPEVLVKHYRMPLWNYLFEIHNGRFFTGLMGKYYILVIPLGALTFILLTLSGVYDWLYPRMFRKKSKSLRA